MIYGLKPGVAAPGSKVLTLDDLTYSDIYFLSLSKRAEYGVNL